MLTTSDTSRTELDALTERFESLSAGIRLRGEAEDDLQVVVADVDEDGLQRAAA